MIDLIPTTRAAGPAGATGASDNPHLMMPTTNARQSPAPPDRPRGARRFYGTVLFSRGSAMKKKTLPTPTVPHLDDVEPRPGRPPLPPGKAKTVQVNVRMTPPTAARVDAVRELDPDGLPTRAAAALLCLEAGLDVIEQGR